MDKLKRRPLSIHTVYKVVDRERNKILGYYFNKKDAISCALDNKSKWFENAEIQKKNVVLQTSYRGFILTDDPVKVTDIKSEYKNMLDFSKDAFSKLSPNELNALKETWKMQEGFSEEIVDSDEEGGEEGLIRRSSAPS